MVKNNRMVVVVITMTMMMMMMIVMILIMMTMMMMMIMRTKALVACGFIKAECSDSYCLGYERVIGTFKSQRR